MKIKGLGLFSSLSSIVAAVVTILGISGVALAGGGAMFNPGPLSAKSGAPLSGVTSHSEIQDCAACHTSFLANETMSDRCLVCHTNVAAEIAQPTSLHGVIKITQPDMNCRTCHTEHHGPTASLTRLPPGWNPHDQLGFSLKAHVLRSDGTPFACADCHTKGYQGPFDQAACADCHLKINPTFAQAHILAYSTNCTACHDGIDSHGSKFDHNTVAFKLAGVHAVIACAQCHNGNKTLAEMQATPQNCVTCHQKDDIHAGAFGTKCEGCHTPDSWKKVTAFDHNLTNFKLIGLHVSAACESCHVNNVFKGTPADCFSCHAKDDKHNGTFGTNCGMCHTPLGWKQTVDHSKFAFHLDGKHATVACTACHINGVFIGTPMDCVSCHAKDDVHSGTLGMNCATCHNPSDWASATIDHNKVGFSLQAHATKTDGTAFACADCHTNGYGGTFDQNVCAACHIQINQAFATDHILTFGANCMACHDGVDSHGKNFNHNLVSFALLGKHSSVLCSACHINDHTLTDLKATPQDCNSCHAKDDAHSGGFGTDCATCHTSDAWTQAKVDHSKFAFHLDGKHATVACASCHLGDKTMADFKGTPQDCNSCHAKDDAHSGALGTNCATCHTPDKWTTSTFDHMTFAAFPLMGKHLTLQCTACHADKTYVGAPTDCIGCHAKDDIHKGANGTNCAMCHMPTAWKPATVDHSQFAFHLDGTHATVACAGCHANETTMAQYQATPQTCAACHQPKDDVHNGALGSDCATCHTPDKWTTSTFDHTTFAGFKLTGKHTSVACASCHADKTYVGTPTDCNSCHAKDDTHKGKFGPDCATCHTPDSWTTATVDHNTVGFSLNTHTLKTDGTAFACADCHANGYGTFDQTVCATCHIAINATFTNNHIATFGTSCMACHDGLDSHGHLWDHNKVAFGITGKHVSLDCSACHNIANGGASTLTMLKATPTDCATCHKKDDHHAGAFGTACGSCHVTDGWNVGSLGSVTASTHATFAFHLDGKHAVVACEVCHAGATTLADFKATLADCASCHLKDDAHNDATLTQTHTLGTNCATCHTPDKWTTSTFDHTTFQAFPLTGFHTSLLCTACHADKTYVGALTNCNDCHAKNDIHKGANGTDCAMCHNTTAWKPATVDHSQFAFHLDGTHATVACSGCHANETTTAQYQATPQTCAACHQPKDDVHNGALGSDCATCHTPDKWPTSTFDHTTFAGFKLTGKHTTLLCTACHADKTYVGAPTDCVGCHLKDDAHKGKFGTTCGSCHTTDSWLTATIDHNTVGFSLQAHTLKTDGTAFACADCHVNGYGTFDQSACVACHTTINATFMTNHTNTFGATCMNCHDGLDSHGHLWDHNKVAFGITGKHILLDCAQCHNSTNGGASDLTMLKATPTDCATCHTKDDHHGGAFGMACGSCHVTDGWNVGSLGSVTASTHATFAFHLDGKHAAVACEVCHNGAKTPADFKATPIACVSCHLKDDAHNGTLGTDCGMCHTPAAWTPASVDHSKFAFHLDGKHAAVACASCHTNSDFKNTPQDCASCHTKDDAHTGALGTNCATCHTPADWPTSTFDHTTFQGFPLTGFHTTLACTACHADKTYVGAPTNCNDCHAKDDFHKGANGTDCAMCHNTTAWKPATVDHSKFAFHLDGQHATVACALCHANETTLAQYQATPQDCASCHASKDVHGGTLGTNCASCHTPTDWTVVTSFDHSKVGFSINAHPLKADGVTPFPCADCHTSGYGPTFDQNVCAACHTTINATFMTNHTNTFGATCMNCHDGLDSHGHLWDHNKVAFGITGKHILLDCAQCHNSTNGGASDLTMLKATPTDCATCHTKDDHHGGAFGMACGSCHVTDGWNVGSLGSVTASTHATFAFHLDGKHAAVACEVCHNGAKTPADFKATPIACVSCHLKDDAHNGTLGTDCGMCHTPAAWTPASVDHSKFAFHLDGKHAAVACASCHTNSDFKNTPQDCASCHTKDDAHTGALGTNCATCHTPADWPTSTFDHTTFQGFPLTGFHTTLACTACHADKTYVGAPTNCNDCHAKDDFHKGANGTDCAMCHNTTAWKPATVDHSKFAFHLDGQHATVACALCHANETTLAQYQATPQDCASCHASKDVHGGTLGTNCASCHTPTDWTVVTSFDHSKVGFSINAHPLKADGVTPFPCADCHTSGYGPTFDQNVCAACHTTINATFMTNHTNTFGATCMNCHDGLDSHGHLWDHNKVAFALNGMHASVTCAQCHTDGGASTLATLKATPTDCGTCHANGPTNPANPHGNTVFGTTCGSCHVPDGWSLGIPTITDHAKFAFHLDGTHATITCEACHTGKTSLVDFKTTPTDCASCHLAADVHNNTSQTHTLGSDCATCHVSTTWPASTFDHTTFSGFPLTGEHTTVPCADCHGTTDKSYVGAPTNCYGCHAADDHHNGAFGTACEACHVADGWNVGSMASITVATHATFAFHLDGFHGTVATCEICHNGETTPAAFPTTSTACVSCHLKNDAHSGALGTNCATCHTAGAVWANSTFDHTTFSGFPLTGFHTTIACTACHADKTYVGAPTACYQCHTGTNVITGLPNTPGDPHNGTNGTACEACHQTTDWTTATVDHSKFAFQLVGFHATVACGSCHAGDTTLAQFQATPQDCWSCHKNITPGDAHTGALGTNCATCHTPLNQWANSTFNHLTFTAFPLTGFHTTLACTACHTDKTYMGAPTTCNGCHAVPNYHNISTTILGTNCSACHTTTDWTSSTLTGYTHQKIDGSFPHHKATCYQCHPNTLTPPKGQTVVGTKPGTVANYTCMACHNNNNP